MRSKAVAPSPDIEALRTVLDGLKSTLESDAANVAESFPPRFDDYWRAGRAVVDGPIDVIDFFSG